MQNTPSVNRDDVTRVVSRDFPDREKAVLELLKEVSCSLIGRDRLHLAHLKNSGGSIDKLHDSLAIADSRDVVCAAEYPGYCSLSHSKMEKMPSDQKQVICADDWRQYKAWLDAE